MIMNRIVLLTGSGFGVGLPDCLNRLSLTSTLRVERRAVRSTGLRISHGNIAECPLDLVLRKLLAGCEIPKEVLLEALRRTTALETLECTLRLLEVRGTSLKFGAIDFGTLIKTGVLDSRGGRNRERFR